MQYLLCIIVFGNINKYSRTNEPQMKDLTEEKIIAIMKRKPEKKIQTGNLCRLSNCNCLLNKLCK